MYCRVLACDFDGTGASGGHLAPEVARALARARAAGVATMLVTGRVLEELELAGVDLALFDAVVAENGAVVMLPASGRELLVGPPPPGRLLARLRDAGVPFHSGRVVVGTSDQHAGFLLDFVRREGLDVQLVFNRAALMLLPTGVNKAVGVERALAEIGRAAANVIAFGDAENDLPLFALAEVAVAARGSVPAAAAAADEQLSRPNGEGVASYVERLLDAGCTAPTPSRRLLTIGLTESGGAVQLPTSGVHVLVSGDARSGKSWATGLIVEQLLEAGRRVCVVDPEGDHAVLGAHPGVLVFGTMLPLPAPEAIPSLLRRHARGVVVDLATLEMEERVAYVRDLLPAIARERAESGLPHWTVIDEAQAFFHGDRTCALEPGAAIGSFLLSTYRPSLLPAELHEAAAVHLVTRTVVDDERYFVEGLLKRHGPPDLDAAQALSALGPRRLGLLRSDGDPRWSILTPLDRATPHTHHARKYAVSPLSPDRAFHFRMAAGPRVAHGPGEFCEAVRVVGAESLRHHMRGGDFSRWAADVLGDAGLAAGLRKLEAAVRAGAAPRADEIVQHVVARYVV